MVKTKRESKFSDTFSQKNLTISYKVVTDKEFKKIIEEVAELLYDYYRQRQKNQSRLSSSSGEPQQEVA